MINFYLDFSPQEIILNCGGVRCFKTLDMVRTLYVAYNHGYEIITNVTLNKSVFKHYIKLDSNDPGNFIKQLRTIMNARRSERDYHKAFLGVDEASGIADSQKWKFGVEDSDIWKQLGKVGITSSFVYQARNMAYNRIRDNCSRLKITRRMTDDEKNPAYNYYTLSVFKQNEINQDQYDPVITSFPINAEPYFKLYDTREILYLK